MTTIPFTTVSEGVLDTTSLSEEYLSITNQDSVMTNSSASTDNSTDFNNNDIDPPPDLPHPMHLPPEEPSQVPTPDLSLPTTRN